MNRRRFASRSGPSANPEQSSQPGYKPVFDSDIKYDKYSENPPFPAWDDDTEYVPWSDATDEKYEVVMRDANGQEMFGIADWNLELRQLISGGSTGVRVSFMKLIEYADTAIKGKRDALRALHGAHARIRNQEAEINGLKEFIDSMKERHDQLARDHDRLEGYLTHTEERTATLENERVALSKETHVLRREKEKLKAAWEDELSTIEGLVGNWEKMTGKAEVQTVAGRLYRGDHETRFNHLKAAIQEAAVESARTFARYESLLQEYGNMEKKYMEAAETAEEYQAEAESNRNSKISETQVKTLKAELASQKMRVTKLVTEHAAIMEGVRKDREELQQKQQAEIDRLHEEGRTHKKKWESLQRAVNALKQELANTEVAASEESTEQKISLEALSRCIRDLDSMVASVVGDFDAQPSPGSIHESIQAQASLRERGAAQLEKLRSSGDILTKISAGIVELEQAAEQASGRKPPGTLANIWNFLSRSSSGGKQSEPEAKSTQTGAEASEKAPEEASEAPAEAVEGQEEVASELPAVEYRSMRPILGALDKIKFEVGSLAQHYTEALQSGSDMQNHLDTLHSNLRSQERAIFNIFDRVHRELGQAGMFTAPASGQATITRPSASAWDELFGPENIFIRSLEAVINLIGELRVNSEDLSPERAARDCMRHLETIIERLRSTEPDVAARQAITAFNGFLEENLRNGLGDDRREAFLEGVAKHENDLKRLLSEERYAVGQLDTDRELLEGILQKIEAVRELQRAQKPLVEEYETHRIDREKRPALSQRQSEEVWRLARSFIEKWRQRSRAGRVGPDGAQKLTRQVMDIVADSTLRDRRRQLREGLNKQNEQISLLEEKMTQARELADDLRTQREALSSDQQKPDSETNFNRSFEAGLDKREKRLRHEQNFNQACTNQVISRRNWVAEFIEKEADKVRRQAEKIVAEALLQLEGENRPGPGPQHGGALCFCVLLRYFLPGIYYRIVYNGCCGVNQPRASSSSPQANSCQAHHGHGLLPATGRVWTSICHVGTSLLWLLFLFLLQPYSLLAAFIFVLSLILGLPRYLLYLARVAYAHASYRVLLFRHRRYQARLSSSSSSSPFTSPSTSPQDPSTFPRTQPTSHPPPPPPTPSLSTLYTISSPLLPLPQPCEVVGAVLAFVLVFITLSYLALTVERGIWLGENNSDWRNAYIADLTTRARNMQLPYPEWSPMQVDYRLLVQPLWAGVEEWVHWLFYGGNKGVGEGLDQGGTVI